MQIDGQILIDILKAQRNEALDMVAFLQAQNAVLTAVREEAAASEVVKPDGD